MKRRKMMTTMDTYRKELAKDLAYCDLWALRLKAADNEPPLHVPYTAILQEIILLEGVYDYFAIPRLEGDNPPVEVEERAKRYEGAAQTMIEKAIADLRGRIMKAHNERVNKEGVKLPTGYGS